MIRSTKHNYHYLNEGKRILLMKFIEEYSDTCIKIVNEIWENGYKDFSITENRLSIPRLLDYKVFNQFRGNLSSGSFKLCVNQAGGIIRAVIEKQRRRNWVQENKGIELKKLNFTKPNLSFVAPQICSYCVDIELTSNSFDGFVRIKYYGLKVPKIKIPISANPQFKKWKSAGGRLMNSVKLFKTGFQLAWDVPRDTSTNKGSKLVGLDQGFTTVATLSDGQSTPDTDNHGHSLKSILEKLSRKKKGSKSFRRAQAHRKNFVNWSINQLNFTDVKEVRLEKIVNIRFRKKSSRIMSHWSNPEIRDKIKARCEELEVPVVEQSSPYRSQRCHQCGQVRSANRKGKVYSCKNCSYVGDSDFNAAMNHELDLPSIPFALCGRKLNKGNGFFWKPEGLFDFSGSELLIPGHQEQV